MALTAPRPDWAAYQAEPTYEEQVAALIVLGPGMAASIEVGLPLQGAGGDHKMLFGVQLYRRKGMSVEHNKQLVRRLVEEVMNAGRTEIVSKLFVPGSFLAGAFEKKGREVRASFPDLRMTIEAMVAEGDQVVVVLSGQGTQLGPFMGRAPSGKLVVMSLFMLYRIQDGRIASARFCDDRLGVMQQLGLLTVEGQ